MLLLEGVLVVAILAVVVAGTQLSPHLIAFRVTPVAVLIPVIWVIGLLLLQRAGHSLPWHESGEAPDSQQKPRGHSQQQSEKDATAKGTSTAKSATIFGVAALVTLVAGVGLERSGDAIAGHIGLSGVLFGATILAAATSLPEVSTGLTSVRNGDDKLAVSDIFGGNAFLPVLFLPATLISGEAVLPQAQSTDIYLTALGALLTLVFVDRAAVPAAAAGRTDGGRLARRPPAVRRRRGRPVRRMTRSVEGPAVSSSPGRRCRTSWRRRRCSWRRR